MTIRQVFRVQCDGPCRGWLSWREGYVPGTDMRPEDHVVEPTAVRALNWPTDHAARVAAQRLGWHWVRGDVRPHMCPECAANPLGIVIPQVVPARFAVYGPVIDEEIPYAMIDTDEWARTDTVTRERVEADVRLKFRELHPGVPIHREVWTP